MIIIFIIIIPLNKALVKWTKLFQCEIWLNEGCITKWRNSNNLHVIWSIWVHHLFTHTSPLLLHTMCNIHFVYCYLLHITFILFNVTYYVSYSCRLLLPITQQFQLSSHYPPLCHVHFTYCYILQGRTKSFRNQYILQCYVVC